MRDVWSERAQAYRDSPAHREGPDLDLIVEWATGLSTALDVGTGGGHVARRLREAGLEVVTCDPAPGMRPDVICRAEDLPFDADSFDAVVTRIAAHHFSDVAEAVREMARIARGSLIVEDTLFSDETVEEAERLRDPTHVRCYSESEWKEMLTDAGLEVERAERFDRRRDVDDWLARVETPQADAERVRELLATRIADGTMTFPSIVIKARQSQR
jgi:SAM-dependent methyltransferase